VVFVDTILGACFRVLFIERFTNVNILCMEQNHCDEGEYW